MAFKSSLRTVGMLLIALSVISLAAHFLLARYYTSPKRRDEHSIALFGWRMSSADEPPDAQFNPKVWTMVKALQFLRPHASPRGNYPVPTVPTAGYLFAEIRGDFHEIRSSICDLIVVARILNVTLVIPRLKEVVSKQISSKFKGFDYIYDEEYFIAALADDVPVVKHLPAKYSSAKKSKSLMIKSPRNTATVDYYLREILPGIKREGAVGLAVSGGGCLQNLLPPEMEEYQRLRCRVAFHALRFRKEIQELGTKMVSRLKSAGRPYIAVYLGLEKETLAYHGCAERFQDVHTELIQQKRAKMSKQGLVRGELNVDSEKQWLNGSCPLMPDEVGILLRALGYKRTSRIYIPGVEVFGGQRVILPLRSMYPILEDRTTLSTPKERFTVYGEEEDYPPAPATILPKIDEKARLEGWEKAGPRPRPLPPPAGRPKYSHELDGWWGWVGESAVEPPPTPRDLRIRAHKLLWQALDYIVCTEADVFFTAFDEDKSGHPNFASLVMGHRAYAAASRRTYRPDRKLLANLISQVRDRLHDPGRAWLASARNSLLRSMGEEGIIGFSSNVKPASFLSHPLPECVCRIDKADTSSNSSSQSAQGRVLIYGEELCPEWMKNEASLEQGGGIEDEYMEVEAEDDNFEGAKSPLVEAEKGDESSLLNEGEDDNDPND